MTTDQTEEKHQKNHVKQVNIEDITRRYIHMFTEEHDSDVVKKVRIKDSEMPFYLISLIEHKSQIDYNVVMQVFRYMAFIWEDYVKEIEQKHSGICKTEAFAEQIKERKMGELLANFEGWDVQAIRKEAREEAREEGIGKLLSILKALNISKNIAQQQIMKEYALSEIEAGKMLELYW